MKAWRVNELGQPRDVLALEETADPTPNATEMLVKVLAAPANFPDVLMCRGVSTRSSRRCPSHPVSNCVVKWSRSVNR